MFRPPNRHMSQARAQAKAMMTAALDGDCVAALDALVDPRRSALRLRPRTAPCYRREESDGGAAAPRTHVP